jgi:transcriptional regulator with XRE-family HTH domain
MWLENLKELKKSSGMSAKQIGERAKLPEKTINRILSGDTDHPRIDTLVLIVEAMGGKMRDIFADTNIVVATEALVEAQGTVEVVEAENNVMSAKNEMLEAKNAAMNMEIELLKKELKHKDELLALHNYYISLIRNTKDQETTKGEI